MTTAVSAPLTLRRASALASDVRDAAQTIVADVRRRGDTALFDMVRRFDGVQLRALEVPPEIVRRAFDNIDTDLRRAMEHSARNIERVHRAFAPKGHEIEVEPGVLVGRRCDPLSRVGVYAPGGRASYPSSVFMAAIPARVAGVGEVILTSPPDPSGFPAREVLAAAALAKVDRVFALGGAGAIAALAYGTCTVPRVDRIVGPGNAYVAAAKLAVVADVSIDCPAGPSELLVIADSTSDPAGIAAEMVAQAEHDPMAFVAALVVGDDVADAIERELSAQADRATRRDVVLRALETSGGVFRLADCDAAIQTANEFAPEHLLLAVDSAAVLLPRVRHAGTVFVGSTASVAFGDYMTGANHVLPTGGLARCYSGLSTLDFVRWTTYQRVTPIAANDLSADAAAFADAEGLPAHADAARRFATVIPSRVPAERALRNLHLPDAQIPRRAPRDGNRRTRNYRRRAFADLLAYAPDRGSTRIDLSDNTNRWGMPPASEEAIRRIARERVTRYPEAYAESLKDAVSEYLGVPASHVVTGCGSDDVLASAICAFGEPASVIAIPDPTFPMIEKFARMNGLRPELSPLTSSYDVDADRVLWCNPGIAYVCSPNNPTGGLASRAAIQAIADRIDGVLIVDEAYAEFAGVSALDLAITTPNVLVVRTMSKAFGLAGLRVGYAVGAPDLVMEVEKARGPYKVSATGAAAAVAALREGLPWVREHITLATQCRDRLVAALRSRGIPPIDSTANFVLVPMENASDAAIRMRELGVAVRAFSGLTALSGALARTRGDALRISVGPWDELQAALDALHLVVSR